MSFYTDILIAVLLRYVKRVYPKKTKKEKKSPRARLNLANRAQAHNSLQANLLLQELGQRDKNAQVCEEKNKSIGEKCESGEKIVFFNIGLKVAI